MSAILKYIQPRLHALSNGLFANWMPDNAVSVGDYGILKNGGFERLGSLQDYGAQIDAQPATAGKNELEYKDKIDLSVNAMAEAALPAKQGAKIGITIKGKGAFLYHLSDVSQIRPINQRTFEEEVAKSLISTSLALPDGAVIVTEVQHAAKATIIASDGSEGRLDLNTNFNPTGSAFLSGARGSVSVGGSAGSIFSWIARSDTVTLLRLVRPKIPSPGGPGGAVVTASGLEKVLAWARDLFRERQLRVSDLVIHHVPGPAPGVVVAIERDELTLFLPELTTDELMMTIPSDAEHKDEGRPEEIEIQEQEFGSRYMTG